MTRKELLAGLCIIPDLPNIASNVIWWHIKVPPKYRFPRSASRKRSRCDPHVAVTDHTKSNSIYGEGNRAFIDAIHSFYEDAVAMLGKGHVTLIELENRIVFIHFKTLLG